LSGLWGLSVSLGICLLFRLFIISFLFFFGLLQIFLDQHLRPFSDGLYHFLLLLLLKLLLLCL
jgi:hypothetical protein